MRFWISTTFQLGFRLCDVVKCHSYRKSAIFRDAIVSTKRKIENWDRNSFPPAALKSTKKSRGNYRWCGRQWHWQVPKRDMNANQYQLLHKQCDQNTWKIWEFCNLGSWGFEPGFWNFDLANLTSKFRLSFGSTLALLFRCETTRKFGFSKHLVKNYHANCPHDWRISAMQWEEQLRPGLTRTDFFDTKQTADCPGHKMAQKVLKLKKT